MTDSPIREHGDVERLYEALAMARHEFAPIAKRKTANVIAREGKRGYSYKYAELSDVNDATVPALSKYGLAVTQPTDLSRGSMMVVTRLAHRSGAWIESDYPVAGIAGAIAHQVIGGALTYARRYALCSMLNVSGEDDVDSGEEREIDDRAPWPDQQAKPAPARAEPPRRAPPQQPSGKLSTGGEAPSSTGATTPTTSEATAPKPKASVIDKDDPLIVDLKANLASWDQLRRWYAANKDAIDQKTEDWKNEFFPRYDEHASRLKKEAEAKNAG